MHIVRSLTHLLQNSRVYHLGYLMIEFGHLSWVHILTHITSYTKMGRKKSNKRTQLNKDKRNHPLSQTGKTQNTCGCGSSKLHRPIYSYHIAADWGSLKHTHRGYTQSNILAYTSLLHHHMETTLAIIVRPFPFFGGGKGSGRDCCMF